MRVNYAVRSIAFAFAALPIGLYLREMMPPGQAWALFFAQFFLYPHLLYWRARQSARPNRAELDNLLLDAALLGAWSAYLGFPTWITYALVGATTLNAAVNRGALGVVLSLGCTLAGAALWVALSSGVGGFRYTPETSDWVTALCALGALVYMGSVGYVVYRKNRSIARTRDQLRASEERYRLIAENAADLIALVDHDNRWLYTSPSYKNILAAEDLVPGVDAWKRAHPDDAEQARVALLRSVATGKPRELALRLVDRDGRIRQYEMRIQPVGEGDAARAVLLVSLDVTALRESEERLLLAAHALEGMTEAIMITAADGTVVTVNRAFTEVTGYTRDDVLGQPEKTLRNALQPPEFYDELYAIVQREGYWSGTTWSKRKNGSVYREWRSVRAVREAGGAVTHYVNVFYEVSAGKLAGASPNATLPPA